MKVRITEHTIAQRRQVAPGEELEVSKEEAGILISARKAIALTEVVEKAVLPAPETTNEPKPEKPKAAPVPKQTAAPKATTPRRPQPKVTQTKTASSKAQATEDPTPLIDPAQETDKE